MKLNHYVVGLNPDRLLALREVRDRFIAKEHPPASTLAGVQALSGMIAWSKLKPWPLFPEAFRKPSRSRPNCIMIADRLTVSYPPGPPPW